MLQKGFVFGIVILLISSVVSAYTTDIQNEKSMNESITLYVGGSGPGNFTKIQYAIDAANENDTVYVYDDSSPYYESLIISKTISLIGENKETTVIDGINKNAPVIEITADNVTIQGFTIQHGYLGIDIRSNNNQIVGNIIQDNTCFFKYHLGILLSGYSNLIKENIIRRDRQGIHLDGPNFVTNNFIVHNYESGICEILEYGGTTATWNVIADNGDGIFKWGGYSNFNHNDFFFNTRNAHVDGNRYHSTWYNETGGNYWDDWKENPGYPNYYVITGLIDEYDMTPSTMPWQDSVVVGINLTYYAERNQNIIFEPQTNKDPDTLSWYWEFGDGSTSTSSNPEYEYSHTGAYLVNITVIDSQGNTDTDKAIARIGLPPGKPTISGPTRGKPGVLYNYTISSVDPDGDPIWYDVTTMEDGLVYEYKIGPYASGKPAVFQHSWEFGSWTDHTIIVYAMDNAGLTSPEASFSVTMPRSRSFDFPFLKFLERFPHAFPILRELMGLK